MKVIFPLILSLITLKALALDCNLPAPWDATTTLQFGHEDHRSANSRVLQVGIDCMELNPIINLYSEMLVFLPTTWPRPSGLILNVIDKASNAYVNGNRVNLPLHFINEDKEKIDDQKILAIWAHEFAHVFLNTFMQQEIPEMIAFNEIYYPLLSAKANRAVALENIAYYQVMGNSSVKEYFAAQKSYSQMNEEIRQFEKQIDQLENSRMLKVINRISKPYHEFFADLVTVLYFNNPRAIAESLKIDYDPAKDKKVSYRDFSYIGNSIAEWEGNLDDLKDSHHTMAASRYEIGKFLTALNLEKKHQLLEKIAHLIIAEIKRQVENDEADSPLELNRSFIQKFHQQK